MGIQHFSGLFVLLCIGVGGALLTLAGEHTFYHLVIPRLRRTQSLQYWLHTSQVSTCTRHCGALFSTGKRCPLLFQMQNDSFPKTKYTINRIDSNKGDFSLE